MNEVWIVLALIVGFGIGYAVRWRTSGTPADAHSVRQKLEKARFELDQQRQEMADYFEQSHATLLQLSQDVDRANRLWNESASHLFEEQLSTAKLPLHQPDPEPLTTEDQQPNDYVHGSHGIISPRKKVS